MTTNANAVQLLIDDHRRVAGLFQQLHGATDAGQKHQIAQLVMTELDVHAAIEEEIFYPALRGQGDARDKELVAEAYEDHAAVKELISRLWAMTPQDPQFDALVEQLQQEVEQHVQEEETELLPKAQEELIGRLDALGEELLARKQQLMSTLQQPR